MSQHTTISLSGTNLCFRVAFLLVISKFIVTQSWQACYVISWQLLLYSWIIMVYILNPLFSYTVSSHLFCFLDHFSVSQWGCWSLSQLHMDESRSTPGWVARSSQGANVSNCSRVPPHWFEGVLVWPPTTRTPSIFCPHRDFHREPSLVPNRLSYHRPISHDLTKIHTYVYILKSPGSNRPTGNNQTF